MKIFPGLTKLIYGTLPILRHIETTISAGFGSPAEDYMEKALDMNAKLMKHPESTYTYTVSGDSMVGAFIHHDDVVVVDAEAPWGPGDIVVAFWDGNTIIKRVRTKDGKVYLCPESPNPIYQPILVDESANFRVFGVVKHLVRTLKG
jgi:DNA polymerase V